MVAVITDIWLEGFTTVVMPSHNYDHEVTQVKIASSEEGFSK